MFIKEVNEIDLGETHVDNIFIDIFMPMANGLYVKVYLLGYRYACDSSYNPNFNNNSIARNLNVPLSDVLSAWDFWESKGIIRKQKNYEKSEYDYSVEFLDLKKLYIENILNPNQPKKGNTDDLVSINENPKVQKMFNSINETINRPLVPNEKIQILDMMDKYNMNPDMIKMAYEFAKEKRGVKTVNYIEGIIRNWYDAKIYTPEDLQNSLSTKNERYIIYKTIFNELGFSREPSKSEKEIIDTWIDKMNFDIELILEACSKSKNTSNPSIAYINGVLKSWNEKGFKKVKDVESKDNIQNNQSKQYSQPKQYKQQNTYTKTKFHNFEETFTKYSPEELEKLIEASQREKFK
jgi:DnaD/phage-associated family protein